MFDLCAGAALLLTTLPVALVAALLIRLTSRGPVVYGQVRCGKDGRPFTCYKFRTMVDGAHAQRAALLAQGRSAGPVFKLVDDPRTTWLGRRLRRASIDELPQLVNVLRGEMSFVGPRPALPEEIEQYADRERLRLAVKPGLTCLWQVSGRSLIDWERWLELDLEYIERRGFWYDCGLVLRTVPAVLSGRGAF